MIGERFLQQATETIAGSLADRNTDTVHRLFRAEVGKTPLIGAELYFPRSMFAVSQTADYMSASIPMTRDFLHPKYAEFAGLYGLPFELHRKHWEWAFIHERLDRLGVLAPGNKGLGFGVGRERLPALFARAGARVTATDTPSDEQNWAETDQYGGSKEALFAPDIISRELF